MSIGLVKQTGNNIVTVYGTRGEFKCTLSGTLVGYNDSTVSVRVGNITTVYDERGRFLFSR
ncbi:MAG: hypothetical protein IJ866_01335 [Alphaproteobacteria bacterium]|nr:hypothetical protein [Alphaproteobacteria bacterium]